MIVNGKKIAEDIQRELATQVQSLSQPPMLAVVWIGDDPVTGRFVSLKQAFAREIGVNMEIVKIPETTDQAGVVNAVQTLGERTDVDGVIVQLPLPSHIDTRVVLDAVPKSKDVDVLSSVSAENFLRGNTLIFPPVAGAVKEILERNNISLSEKRILVVGRGRLVGAPVAAWLRFLAAEVVTAGKGDDIASLVKEANVIISGAGVPELITPDMVREGVVLIDAGTSESAGKLAGDMDPACAEKASLFTPVPGGVGPITVAVLFQNLVRVCIQSRGRK